MRHDRTQPVVIAGGGLAGSLLAIQMARKGFRTLLFEKREDIRRTDAVSGRSINLALSHRGIRALARVGLDARVLREAIPMRGRRLHEADGTYRFLPYGRREVEYINSVSRTELNRILLDSAEAEGVELHFETGVDSVDPDERAVRVRPTESAETETLPFAALIGADGAASAVRTSLDERIGLGVGQELLEHGYKELTIPPAADGSFRIEPEALHIWPRGTHMLIALPNTDRSFTCTLFMAMNGRPGFEQIEREDELTSFFESTYPDTRELIPDLKSEFFNNPTGILGTIRCDRWHVGATLVLGDAAHAIVPFYGQGMNCAFEDCAVLDEMLIDVGPGSEWTDWEAVFKRFESVRRENANAIADMALENYIEMRDRVADPEFRLRRAVALELERRLPDLFIPMYSLVSFHTIPYRRALEIGRNQEELLRRITDGASALGDIDWDAAEAAVRSAPGDYAPVRYPSPVSSGLQ
ncbi:MAG: FAD-dependent monooxygenase [Rhodothermales bacterium]|nr:FAD-dependent monooxygenase [Rhodothermales bacterium]